MPILYQCHLCNKKVKSSAGLKLHIRSCKKKVNFQEFTADIKWVKSLTEQNETNSMQDFTEETNVLRPTFTTSTQSFDSTQLT